MGVEGKISSQYFLEKYIDTEININSSNNQYGTVSIDERGNYLNAGLIGNQTVFKCSVFSGMIADRYLLIHNSDNEILGMIENTFDKHNGDIARNFNIEGQEIMYYKTNAGTEQETFNGNTATFSDFTTETIFKVYLNGEETTAYTRADNILVFDSGEYNNFSNNVYVIYYPTLQSIAGIDITLHYYSPYEHEVTENSKLGLGYDLSDTGVVSANSNVITTNIDLTSKIEVYDWIRLGDYSKKVLYVDATTIKTDSVFEEGYNAEDIYLLPYTIFMNIKNESESVSETYRQFTSRGVKMPVEVKESVSNRFSFDYYIDESLIPADCNIFRYATSNFDLYVPEINKFRIIRAYYKDRDVDRFIYLTNCRKLKSVPYSKQDIDNYSVEVQFEDKLTLEMNYDWTDDGIAGAGGFGNYRLTRG